MAVPQYADIVDQIFNGYTQTTLAEMFEKEPGSRQSFQKATLPLLCFIAWKLAELVQQGEKDQKE